MKTVTHPEFSVKSGRKVTNLITLDELKQKFTEAVKAHADYEGDSEWRTSRDVLDYPPYFIKELTPQIKDDLKKVEFDTENVNMGARIQAPFQVLPNGLAVLTAEAGGDWEMPVFFFIYWDGSKLRAYIPENGNFWNRTTNQAYGNDEKKDMDDCKRLYGVNYQDQGDDEGDLSLLESNLELMIEDIQKRVAVVV